jgi:hypothetical protein
MSRSKVNIVPAPGSVTQPIQRAPGMPDRTREYGAEFDTATRCNEILGVDREAYIATRQAQED